MKLDKENRLKQIREEYRKGMHVIPVIQGNREWLDNFKLSFLFDYDIYVYRQCDGVHIDGSRNSFKVRIYKGYGSGHPHDRVFLQFFKTEKEMLDTAQEIYLKLLAGYKVEELPNNVNDLIEKEGFKIEEHL